MKAVAVAVLLLLAACSKPQPPEKERPPEPQAASPAAALHAPIDRAKRVQHELDADAQARRAQTEAAGG